MNEMKSFILVQFLEKFYQKYATNYKRLKFIKFQLFRINFWYVRFPSTTIYESDKNELEKKFF